ncbi:endonuclease/exonuclease/phosphatase family protein [Streptomyces sp. 35G-GA-8]|nr:endonuclease/exonuclease/phosphatase family protein [Streptomyces sp. 35G-GA-8]
MTSAHATESSGMSGEGQTAQASVVRNRIMSWNSNGQNLGTPQLVADQIRRFKPQIVLLQESCRGEVDDAVKLLKRQGLVYEAHHADWPDLPCWGQLESAVLVAKGTKIYGSVETALYDESDGIERRKFTMFQTRLAGRNVRVFNTQLSDGGDANLRHSQLLQLTKLTPGTPNAMVAGDLNAQPWYWEMAPIWAQGFADVDPYCKKTWDRRCNGTQVKSGKKFDYILTRGAVRSRACILHTVNLDHRVVVSDMTAGPASHRPCRLV